MIQVDKVQPREFNFSVVIGALGRAGYAEKAFELYKKVKTFYLFLSIFNYILYLSNF